MDSMTSLSAGHGLIPVVHTVRKDEIRSDRASHPCRPFAEEAVAEEGNREGKAQFAGGPDFQDHVRIHSRLQALRAIRTLRASQAEKEREKGEISHVFS